MEIKYNPLKQPKVKNNMKTGVKWYHKQSSKVNKNLKK